MGFKQDSLLFYMYFKLTEEEAAKDSKEAMESCVRIAYRDIQRNLSFTYSGKDLEGAKKEYQKEYEAGKHDFRMYKMPQMIAELIKNLLGMSNCTEQSFDKWHMIACDRIIKEAESFETEDTGIRLLNNFTYGLAQKWLNMALKNMLIMESALNQDSIIKEYSWDMKRFENVMHIPVDSYIIDGANESFGIKEPEKKWSQINDYQEYMRFQDDIRRATNKEGIAPIEWEGKTWISTAQSKK